MTTLDSPLRIGTMAVRNRLYRAPVLEGAGDGDDAAERYARHFVENARHGVGLIIQGSVVHLRGGSHVAGHDAASTPARRCCGSRRWSTRCTREGAAIFLQVGHGGLYAMEAWHEPYASHAAGPAPRRVAGAVAAPAVVRRGCRCT